MSEGDERDIERRKFPAIAMGITGIMLALMLILAGAKYCTGPNAYTGEFISSD